MKAEIELNIDVNGKPCIKFIHHENDKSLEQEVLKTFIKGAKTNDLKLKEISGRLSDNENYTIYEIQIIN